MAKNDEDRIVRQYGHELKGVFVSIDAEAQIPKPSRTRTFWRIFLMDCCLKRDLLLDALITALPVNLQLHNLVFQVLVPSRSKGFRVHITYVFAPQIR